MVMVGLVRDTIHPASHNNSTKISAPAGNFAKMCTSVAYDGSPVRSRSQVCVC